MFLNRSIDSVIFNPTSKIAASLRLWSSGQHPSRGYAARSGSTPLWGASGMVGTGAYSAGSKMPTVLWAPAPTVGCSLFHRKREDPVIRWALIQAPPSKHLEHLAAGELADRSGCRLPIHARSPGDVVERSVGGPARLRVAIENEPERQLGPAQVGHAGIDECVKKLEAKPGSSLRGLPPGGRVAPLAHVSSPSLSLATRL